MNPILIALVCFAAGGLIGYLLRLMLAGRTVPVSERDELKQQLDQVRVRSTEETVRLKAELEFSAEKLTGQKEELLQIRQQLESQFRLMANTILEEKARQFGQEQEKGLKNILEPLKEHIQTFKTDIENRQHKESEERISLREQIRHMMDLNKTLSVEAGNLTQALRGNVKQQGNWGEMILESMLEYSGLQKGYQYFVQERSRNEEGQAIQPDVIVRYPDNRAIVIDSKVSLIHYESYCSAPTPDDQKIHLQQIVRSLKEHINGLSAKSYHDVAEALDFVMMFVPVEAAYITALQGDPALWQYAYSRRVLLISPANLITTMKLVSDMWQRDGINKNAQAIADKAVKLYEKLVGFTEEFEKIGGQLDKAGQSWADARKKLTSGNGNVLAQASQLKQMKISTQKQFPVSLAKDMEEQYDEDLPQEHS
jgi:DNA recombination protein RmuC